MDKVKILRLLDEADDIVSALYRQGANKDYKCKSLREKLKAIAAEISEKPKTNGDKIRAMSNDELVELLIGSYPCDCQHGCPNDCENCIREWLESEVQNE